MNHLHHVINILFANRPYHPPAPRNRRRPIPPSGMGGGRMGIGYWGLKLNGPRQSDPRGGTKWRPKMADPEGTRPVKVN